MPKFNRLFFYTSTLFLMSSLFSQDSQSISEVKKEIRSDGITMFLHKCEEVDKLNQLKNFFEKMDNSDYKKYIDVLTGISKLQNGSGLHDIDAYGYSVAKDGEIFDMDFFAHMKPGNKNSLLWKVMGGEAKKLKTFNLLPENTVFAITLRVDLLSLYNYFHKTLPIIKNMGDEDFQRDIQKEIEILEKNATEKGMPLPKLMEALSTEVTLFLTINENATMKLPDVGEMQQMAIGIVFQRKSDFLASFLAKNVEAEFKPVTIGDFHTVTSDEVLPSGTRPGYAYNKEYFILSSDFNVVENIMNIKNLKNLVKSNKFSKYQNMSRNGNMAFYLSSEVSELIFTLVKNLPAKEKLIAPLISHAIFKNKTPELFGVISKKPNGLKIEAHATFNFPGNLLSNAIFILVPGLAIIEDAEMEMRYKRRIAEREEAEARRKKKIEDDWSRKQKELVKAEEEKRKRLAKEQPKLIADFDPNLSIKNSIPENITKEIVDVSRAPVGSMAIMKMVSKYNNYTQTFRVAIVGERDDHKLVELSGSFMKDRKTNLSTAMILEVDDTGKALKAWGGLIGFDAKEILLSKKIRIGHAKIKIEQRPGRFEEGSVTLLGLIGKVQDYSMRGRPTRVWENDQFPFFGGAIQSSTGNGLMKLIEYKKTGAKAQIKIK